MDNKIQIIKQMRQDRYTMKYIANTLGISRQWAYKLLEKDIPNAPQGKDIQKKRG